MHDQIHSIKLFYKNNYFINIKFYYNLKNQFHQILLIIKNLISVIDIII